MANISTIHTSLSNNRPSNSYGLLSNEATAVMQREKLITPISNIMVVGRKGVVNVNMLYDWWLIYAANKGLVKEGQWIAPNETLDALLADEYIKHGANAGIPFRIQTYLTMLSNHLHHKLRLNLDKNQIFYLRNQENILRNLRKQFKITK
ncbi:unnamed protein product [marine sediment metagenome]|uniref:Uncharacterized protein n=1 Tax=marine sediment metagenome TaxID=412755 RepID=X1ADX5_9ZZZZ